MVLLCLGSNDRNKSTVQHVPQRTATLIAPISPVNPKHDASKLVLRFN